MKYTVEVKKLTRTVVEVDATNKTEAQEKAKKEACFGSVIWAEPHLRTRLIHTKKAGVIR